MSTRARLGFSATLVALAMSPTMATAQVPGMMAGGMPIPGQGLGMWPGQGMGMGMMGMGAGMGQGAGLGQGAGMGMMGGPGSGAMTGGPLSAYFPGAAVGSGPNRNVPNANTTMTRRGMMGGGSFSSRASSTAVGGGIVPASGTFRANASPLSSTTRSTFNSLAGTRSGTGLSASAVGSRGSTPSGLRASSSGSIRAARAAGSAPPPSMAYGVNPGATRLPSMVAAPGAGGGIFASGPVGGSTRRSNANVPAVVGRSGNLTSSTSRSTTAGNRNVAKTTGASGGKSGGGGAKGRGR